MKVCIKDNEFNTNYHEVFGEEKAKADGYIIFEVPDSYEDCVFGDFNANGFNVELYNQRKQKETDEQKIDNLKQMLLNTDYQAIKYAEGELTEEEYAPIKEQRRQWRVEINRLEEELKNGESR